MMARRILSKSAATITTVGLVTAAFWIGVLMVMAVASNEWVVLLVMILYAIMLVPGFLFLLPWAGEALKARDPWRGI